MSPFVCAVFCAILGFVATFVLTPWVLRIIKDKKILDKPVERSSHKIPTPTGGGWAVLPVILIGFLILLAANGAPLQFYLLPVLAVVLMVLSWQDDLAHLDPLFRFSVQAVCVAAAVMILPADQALFQGYLPFWLDRALSFWALLWFVNLYNFMDGLDGMTGVETASIGFASGLIMLAFGVGEFIWPSFGFLIGGAALAFLCFNWHPAKIFIGDVGAVPLGLILGWYLIYFAGMGFVWTACIIPLYYCFDATITLARRLKQGHAVWEPHRYFFFQASVPHKCNHADVVRYVAGINVFLLICAYLVARTDSFVLQLPAILASGFSVIGLLCWFEGMRPKEEALKKAPAKKVVAAKASPVKKMPVKKVEVTKKPVAKASAAKTPVAKKPAVKKPTGTKK